MTDTVDTVETLKLVTPTIFNIAHALNVIGRQKYPEVCDLFPFKTGWLLHVYGDDNWYVARMIDNPGSSGNHTSKLPHADAEEVLQLAARFQEHDTSEVAAEMGSDWHSHFGRAWFGQDRFTYIRSKRNAPKVPDWWSHIATQLAVYLDIFLLPQLQQIHHARIVRVAPASYDLGAITRSLWVLECEEACCQGTGFMLENVGLVTCAHVLGTATRAFRATALSKKYPVSVVRKHSIIDLAVLHIDTDTDEQFEALPRGSSENMKQLDHLAVAGFPNYRLGDSGVIVTGHVAGFRMISAIRRILTNAPIVCGNSGGPVLDADGAVIGVAVTGADRMETAQETEHHGIIPIEALDLIMGASESA